MLETGFQLSVTPIYNFSPSTTATTDTQGAFSLCSKVSASLAVLVVESLDQSGNAYPPTVTPVTQAPDLGTISLGSCRLLCGFAGQAQSAAPADISGVVTTAPVAEQGTLLAQTALTALDGSKNIWNIAIEGLSAGQPDTFQSAAGACPAVGDLCASYTYTLPSQAPVELVVGSYKQSGAPPTYSISATTSAAGSCQQPFLSTIQRSGGSLPPCPVHRASSLLPPL